MSSTLTATGDEIVTTLIMERTAGDRRLAIIVEGDEDCRLLDIHLDHGAAKTVGSGGKSVVLRAAEIADEEGFRWMSFIVDADFTSDAEGSQPLIWSTRNYDLLVDALEIAPYLIRSVAISATGGRHVSDWEATYSTSLLDHVLRVSWIVGRLRKMSTENRLELPMRNLDFRETATSCDDAAVVAWLRAQVEQRTGGDSASESVWQQLVPDSLSSSQMFSMVSSHDLVAALGAVIRHIPGPTPGLESIASSLRVALGCQSFLRMLAPLSLNGWAQSVHNTQIFRCELAA